MKNIVSQKVAVLGASTNPDRISNQAVRMLKEYGHQVFPVNPQYDTVEGIPSAKSLAELQPIDTLSVYIGPQNIGSFIQPILNLKPGRVILNPGTESPELKKALEAAQIPYQEACTLVLLRTQQF